MRVVHSELFKKSFRDFPIEIQRKFEKQVANLRRDIRYPSLRAKKYDESRRIWQARVDKSARFYFLIKDDVYILLYMKHHPK